MKLSLEYDEVVQMLSRELGRDLQEDDITIVPEPFSIEISGLDFEELLRIREARAQPTTPTTPQPRRTEETASERPMVELESEAAESTVHEIAGLLGENQRLAQSGGGAGPVPQDPHNIPDNVEEVPEDFLPPGASYDPPGEMAPEEIRGRR